MELSLWPSTTQPWVELLEAVRHVDRTGWSTVYVADHFMGDGGAFGPEEAPWLEATAVLAALAGSTERVRLAPLVLSATYRHPAVLANWAAAVDQASGGRLTLGIGAGWQRNEHEQYGIELGPPDTRVRRLEEYVQVVRGLLEGERTSLDGDFFSVRDAICHPLPVQRPLPLLIGAKGDRMLGVVARRADRWNMWSTPEVMRERAAVLARRCERIGRDPASVHRSTQCLVLVTDDRAEAQAFLESVAPRAAFAGAPAAFAELVARHVEVGVDELVVPDWHLGRGARRTDALDALREAAAPLLG